MKNVITFDSILQIPRNLDMLLTFKSSVEKTFLCLDSHYHGNSNSKCRFYIIFHEIYEKYQNF